MVIQLQIPTCSSIKCFHSRSTILMACLLTFLYLVELIIGVRTVCYAFQLSKRKKVSASTEDDLSWIVVVSSLLYCVVTCTIVNTISAFWDSKRSIKIHRAVYYFFHILIGGVLWRYVGLWKCDDMEAEKEEAMLLASLKFLFTQVYTTPLVILHIYFGNDLYEMMYVCLVISCITLSLSLTSSVFHQYKECGNYPYETMALVPLLFKRKSEEKPDSEPKKVTEESMSTEENSSVWKQFFCRVLVAIQTFCFSFGRIIALGMLLKLTGVYAFTIVFLQFLLSMLYLKFQGSHLVPESLSKTKQLMRIAFLSYNLIFDWHLYRETPSGYNLKTGTRYGMLYYTVVTLESMFYLGVWGITTDVYLARDYADVPEQRKHYVTVVVAAGCVGLVISYVMQGFTVFYRKCRTSKNNSSPSGRDMFATLVSVVSRRKSKEPKSPKRVIPRIDITSFSDHCESPKPMEVQNQSSAESMAKDYGSYRDLKEAINYELGIKSKNAAASLQEDGKDESSKRYPDPKAGIRALVCPHANPDVYTPKTKARYLKKSQTPAEDKSTPADDKEDPEKSYRFLQSKLLTSLTNFKRPSDNIVSNSDQTIVAKKLKGGKNEPSSQRYMVGNDIKSTVSAKLQKMSSNAINKILNRKIESSSNEQDKDIKIATIMNTYVEELKEEKIMNEEKASSMDGVNKEKVSSMDGTHDVENRVQNSDTSRKKQAPKLPVRNNRRKKFNSDSVRDSVGETESLPSNIGINEDQPTSNEVAADIVFQKEDSSADQKRRLYKENSRRRRDSSSDAALSVEESGDDEIIYESSVYDHLKRRNCLEQSKSQPENEFSTDEALETNSHETPEQFV